MGLIVAGGISLSTPAEVLTSVEVFQLDSKAWKRGGDLLQARAFFQIVPVGSSHPRLLALGGQAQSEQGSSLTVATSEWWEEEEDAWQEGPGLATGRSTLPQSLPRLILSALRRIS